MPRGGWRRGAGRKPTDSAVKLPIKRQMDLLEKIRQEIKDAPTHITFKGQDVLSFFIAVARNKNLALGVRMEAAKAAAPYLHVRRTATEITGKDGGPLLIEQIANAALAVVAAEREEEKRKQALH